MTATLPHRHYHDNETFGFECERLFRRHWWLLGPDVAVAENGAFLARCLVRWPLVVVRDQHGELHGFYNLCRHRAGPLVTNESGRVRDFVCRYHGWRYACSGELLKTPGFEAAEVGDRAQLGLQPIRVATWNGMLFACLDDDAPELAEWLGDVVDIAARFVAPTEMQFDGEVRKPAACNWKTYADNSCEGYHVGMVHGALGSSLEREAVEIAAYENGQFVGFDVTYGGGLDESRAGRGFWIYKFPGLLLHFSEYAFNAESVLPVSPGAIELRRWFWSDSDGCREHGVDPASIRPNSERVMDEDVAICEAVQRNLASGAYPGGQLSPRQEPGTIYFQQLVREVLDGMSGADARRE
jgi:choline monooxygenase